MFTSIFTSLTLGLVTGTLWRIALGVSFVILIVWALRHARVVYDGRTFLGQGSVILGVLLGFVFAVLIQRNTVPKLQAEIKIHKAMIEDCAKVREDQQAQIAALEDAVEKQKVAVAKAKVEAEYINTQARKKSRKVYKEVRAVSQAPTKDSQELNDWFASTLSDYQLKAG